MKTKVLVFSETDEIFRRTTPRHVTENSIRETRHRNLKLHKKMHIVIASDY